MQERLLLSKSFSSGIHSDLDLLRCLDLCVFLAELGELIASSFIPGSGKIELD